MCLDKRVVVEWVSCCSAYFTTITQSHNFDKAFPVKLAIYHLQHESMLFRLVLYLHASFFFFTVCLSRLGDVCYPQPVCSTDRLLPARSTPKDVKCLITAFLSDVQLQLTALGLFFAATNKAVEYHLKSHLFFQLEVEPRTELKYGRQWYSLKCTMSAFLCGIQSGSEDMRWHCVLIWQKWHKLLSDLHWTLDNLQIFPGFVRIEIRTHKGRTQTQNNIK